MLFDNNSIDDLSLLNLAGLSKGNIVSFTKLNDRNILTAKEGFLRGNMFKDEYLPYKNLTYINIMPKNDREAKLFNIMAYSFAINDLNLWLDLHPEDNNKLMLLEELIKEEKKAKEEYNRSYGPLDICETKGNAFEWVQSPWPWDGLRGDIYV